jgi:hypothetical protein
MTAQKAAAPDGRQFFNSLQPPAGERRGSSFFPPPSGSCVRMHLIAASKSIKMENSRNGQPGRKINKGFLHIPN